MNLSRINILLHKSTGHIWPKRATLQSIHYSPVHVHFKPLHYFQYLIKGFIEIILITFKNTQNVTTIYKSNKTSLHLTLYNYLVCYTYQNHLFKSKLVVTRRGVIEYSYLLVGPKTYIDNCTVITVI